MPPQRSGRRAPWRDYGALPAGLNNRLSSGRRIRDQYPYTQSPSWQPR